MSSAPAASQPAAPGPTTPRKAWLIWGVGAGVYVLAVFHRTSLGVAGPLAQQRLGLSASQLGAFVMLQLGMYALMQLPTGILVDRYGPRRMLLVATTVMGLAQILFSLVTTFPLALLARGLLGAGDAMTYISVLRLAAGWFPARRYPVITAFTGLLGAGGNLIATLPLTGLLHAFGWGPTFAVAGGLSLAYSALLLRSASAAPFREIAPVPGPTVPAAPTQPLPIQPAPTQHPSIQPAPVESPPTQHPPIRSAAPTEHPPIRSAAPIQSADLARRVEPVGPIGAVGPVDLDQPVELPEGRRVLDEVRQAWRMPAGRLGFWIHFTTMAAPVVFGALWGYPYLTEGLGYRPAVASSLLMVLVVVGLVANLAIGFTLARNPSIRTPIAVVVAAACLVAWLVLIGWPGGRPPFAVLVAVIAVLAVGGPASAVAFMLARDYNPRHRISTATGLVNIGGFCGAVIGTFLVGQILDFQDPGTGARSLTAYRWAFVALVVLTAVGLSRMLTWWLRTRAVVLLAAARGEPVPVTIVPHRWELVDEAILADEAARAAERRGG